MECFIYNSKYRKNLNCRFQLDENTDIFLIKYILNPSSGRVSDKFFHI